MTFKEAVEKILGCNNYNNKQVNCLICGKDCKVDRILDAYKAKVEAMPTILNPYEYVQDQCPGEYKIIEKAITDQMRACKSYLMVQCLP
jgi:hypothetical protein